MNTTYQKIYEAVALIPRGKVMTYGQIAAIVGTHPRVVGKALHRNPDPTKIPCHRVVNAEGKLAKNFAFGGEEGQKLKLESEGIIVVEHRVALK